MGLALRVFLHYGRYQLQRFFMVTKGLGLFPIFRRFFRVVVMENGLDGLFKGIVLSFRAGLINALSSGHCTFMCVADVLARLRRVANRHDYEDVYLSMVRGFVCDVGCGLLVALILRLPHPTFSIAP